jgi:hypothetical protein
MKIGKLHHLTIALLLVCGSMYFCYTQYYPLYLAKKKGPKIVERKSRSNGKGEVTLLSKTYKIDQKYMSMQGPNSFHPEIIMTNDVDSSKTIYLTGVRSHLVNVDDSKTLSAEFFCHSNLTFAHGGITPEKHNESFNPPTHMDWRIFTLIPGKLEVNLPEGFGIPIKANTPLDYFTMTLNQNPGNEPGELRVKTSLIWSDKTTGIQPVFRRHLYVYQQHEETEKDNTVAATFTHSGQLCGQSTDGNQTGLVPSSFGPRLSQHPGATCCVDNASPGGILSQFGSQNTIHWMVPPGEHTYRSDVSNQFKLPYATKAHYVTGHLHPYAKSLQLIDLETKEVLFSIESEDFKDKIGVEKMTEVTSQEGVLIKPEGRYELVTKYHNTSDEPIDAMAILYLYLAENPQSATAQANETAPTFLGAAAIPPVK